MKDELERIIMSCQPNEKEYGIEIMPERLIPKLIEYIKKVKNEHN